MAKAKISISLIIPFLCASFLEAEVTVYEESRVANLGAVEVAKQFDWRVQGGPVDRSITRIDKETMDSVIMEMLGQPKLEPASLPVGDIRVQDINNDGVYEVMATNGVVCRLCPREIFILQNAAGKLVLHQIDSDNAGLRESVVDLDTDGVFEVKANRELDPKLSYGSTHICWMDIYAWNGRAYVESDARFPDYYRTEYIPFAESNIARAKSDLKTVEEDSKRFPEGAGKEYAANCFRTIISGYQMAIGKARREILHEQ